MYTDSTNLPKQAMYIVIAIAIAFVLNLKTASSAFAYSENGVTGVDVHGFNGNADLGCNDSTLFGDIQSYFSANGWTGPQKSVGFYSGDHNCYASLHIEDWHCVGFYDSYLGTINEDIRHLASLLAWFIWDHGTSSGQPVKVVAHSMGGIIIRQALFDTPYMTQFPPYIDVEDVITAGTPHQGLTAGAAWYWCSSCSQVAQVESYNALMSNLNSSSFRGGFGNNPQGSSGTDWTNMASPYDEVLKWGTPYFTVDDGLMSGATHKVEYNGPSPQYDHGGYLTDMDSSWSADCTFSDNAGASWTSTTTMAHSIATMLYAIEYLTW